MTDSITSVPDAEAAEESRDEDGASRDALSPEVAALPLVDPAMYEVEGEYARGGLGRVLLAHDRRLGRTVALKENLSTSAASVARFAREARITARLQHPAIVPVYESGRWPSGDPFYAMRLVRGDSLAAVVARAQGLAERLALVPNLVAVADAVAYAHGQRVIHRDLKPENVLVGALGETVVIDWGLAKALDEDEPESVAFGERRSDLPTHVTVVGSVVGTPAYMAPEQARGEPLDARADVYSLGAVIYYALSGVAPHAGDGTREAVRRRATEVPVPLEARVRDVPRDLATIVRKAMALDRGDRYATARELGEDLRRFQTGQLVSARTYSRWTLLGRWLRAHRAAAGAVTAAAVTLGLVGSVSVRRVVRERNRAEAALVDARRRADALTLLHAQSALEHDPTAAVAWIRDYPESAADQLAAWNVVVEAEARGVARHALFTGDSDLLSLSVSPDGRHAVTSSLQHLLVWDLGPGALRARFDRPWLDGTLVVADGSAVIANELRGAVYEVPLPDGPPRLWLTVPAVVERLRGSPDGRSVLLAGSAGLFVADRATGRSRTLEGHDGPVRDASFVADGASVISSGADHTVRAWDVATGRTRVLWTHDASVGVVARSRAGRWVASGADDGEVRVAPWGEGALDARTLSAGGGAVRGLEFSLDERLLASVGADSGLAVWDVATAQRVPLAVVPGTVARVTFSPDGRLLAAAYADDTLRFWESSGAASAAYVHPTLDDEVAFTSDGRSVLTAGADGTVRVWAAPRVSRTLRGHGGRVLHVVFSPDGRSALTDCDDRAVRLWDLSTGEVRVLGTHRERAYGVEFSHDGAFAVSAGEDGAVGLWDLRAGTGRMLDGNARRVREIAVSPNADLVASAGEDSTLRLWDMTTGAARVLTGHTDGVSRVAFSPDGARVATFGGDRTIRLWDVATGASRVLVAGLGVRADGSFRVAFAPDGRSVAACAGGGALAQWSLAGFELHRWRIPPGDAPCSRLTFSPDGRLLALPVDNTLAILDVRGGTWRSLRGHTGDVHHVHFSPDGRFVATASFDRTARVWELATGAAQIVHRHAGPVFDANFSPDGTFVATASADATAWVGRFDPARGLRPDPAAVRARAAELTSAVIVEGHARTPSARP